jgi:hypothetical protein
MLAYRCDDPSVCYDEWIDPIDSELLSADELQKHSDTKYTLNIDEEGYYATAFDFENNNG